MDHFQSLSAEVKVSAYRLYRVHKGQRECIWAHCQGVEVSLRKGHDQVFIIYKVIRLQL